MPEQHPTPCDHPECPEDRCTRIDLEEVARQIRAAGYPATVEQSGGGCATVYAGTRDDSTGTMSAEVLIGPGHFTGPGWTGAQAYGDECWAGPADPDEADEVSTVAEAVAVALRHLAATEADR